MTPVTKRVDNPTEASNTPSVPEYISPVEKVLALQAEVYFLRAALAGIIEEFRKGEPRGYDGPPRYDEDDPVVIIARSALGTDEGIPGSGQVGC